MLNRRDFLKCSQIFLCMLVSWYLPFSLRRYSVFTAVKDCRRINYENLK